MNEDTTASKIGDKLALADRTAAADVVVPVADAADKTIAIASENVGLIVAGGVAIGLVVAALMPRSKKKKLAKRSRNISAMVGELSKALLAQAGDAASEGRDQLGSLSETIAEKSQKAGKKAGKLADETADHINDGGKAIARTVVKLIEKISA